MRPTDADAKGPAGSERIVAILSEHLEEFKRASAALNDLVMSQVDLDQGRSMDLLRHKQIDMIEAALVAQQSAAENYLKCLEAIVRMADRNGARTLIPKARIACVCAQWYRDSIASLLTRLLPGRPSSASSGPNLSFASGDMRTDNTSSSLQGSERFGEQESTP